ncbi:MAG TPA: tetratricopeptide repeat protein [Vicinamibacteria bacterium]|nr:tetratricopeptide repeat protein [Vicinamibacteria bacterium]
MRRGAGWALLLASSLAARAAADTITLTNGRVIEADRSWYEGSELRYEKDGGIYGLPRTMVQKVEQSGAAPAPGALDPDITKARERLAAGDPVEATRLLRVALGRDPRSLPALYSLTESYLSLGDTRAAQDTASRAVKVDPNDARAHALLGDAYAAGGNRAGAEAEYRRSLGLKADAEVQRKLGDVSRAPADAGRTAQFRLRYDGGVNEPLGIALLEALSATYAEYSKRLGFHPEEPVTVVVDLGRGLEETKLPGWAEALNDGTVRVPALGLDRPTPRLVQLLRHEVAHSFIAARTGGNSPTWLQEGISQWLEGGDPAREDALVAAALRTGRVLPLLTLEGPFQSLAPEDLPLAYAESLSAVAHLLRRKGEAGVVRLLSALGDRLPSEEALPVALGWSYPELQQDWEQYLRGAR